MSGITKHIPGTDANYEKKVQQDPSIPTTQAGQPHGDVPGAHFTTHPTQPSPYQSKREGAYSTHTTTTDTTTTDAPLTHSNHGATPHNTYNDGPTTGLAPGAHGPPTTQGGATGANMGAKTREGAKGLKQKAEGLREGLNKFADEALDPSKGKGGAGGTTGAHGTMGDSNISGTRRP